jgi:hypothetical protein
MKIIKLNSIEDAVRSGPFRRFSGYRGALLAELYGGDGKHEASSHTDDDLIQAIINQGNGLKELQAYLDLLTNPALRFITYKEFVIGTPDDASRDELKKIVEPYRLHKGTLIEPIEFKGKTPIKYRVVAYDDLIALLKARYSTISVAVGTTGRNAD